MRLSTRVRTRKLASRRAPYSGVTTRGSAAGDRGATRKPTHPLFGREEAIARAERRPTRPVDCMRVLDSSLREAGWYVHLYHERAVITRVRPLPIGAYCDSLQPCQP